LVRCQLYELQGLRLVEKSLSHRHGLSLPQAKVKLARIVASDYCSQTYVMSAGPPVFEDVRLAKAVDAKQWHDVREIAIEPKPTP